MKKINNILSGWKSFLIKSEVTEQLAKDRATECEKCDDAVYSETIDAFINDDIKKVSGYICSLCSCPLSAKLRSKNEKCPKNFW